MSIFSDYKVGALTAEEFADECVSFNNRARAEEAASEEPYNEYDACWEYGGYIDQNCELCPHNFECSGYEGEDE